MDISKAIFSFNAITYIYLKLYLKCEIFLSISDHTEKVEEMMNKAFEEVVKTQPLNVTDAKKSELLNELSLCQNRAGALALLKQIFIDVIDLLPDYQVFRSMSKAVFRLTGRDEKVLKSVLTDKTLQKIMNFQYTGEAARFFSKHFE